MRKLYVFLLLVPLVFFLAGLAYSQSGSTGAIEGKVLDEEGSSLPGAEVKISSPDMIGGTKIKQTTNEGKFRVVDLPRGT